MGQALTLGQAKGLLESRKGEFEKALATRVDPEAFLRVAHTALSKTPALLECTPASLLMALMEAAQLGLVPNGVMGEAYIIPYKQTAQFIPGYRGLIKLVRQSGVVSNISARVVYEGDIFDVEYGLEERLIHRPNLENPDSAGRLRFVYAIAHFADGSKQFEVMSRAQVEHVKKKSRASGSGPWVTDYDPMAIKTVIRRLFKYLPSSDTDLNRAIEADNREFEEQDAVVESSEPIRGTRRTEAIKARVGAISPVMVPEEEEEAVVEGEVEEEKAPALAPQPAPRATRQRRESAPPPPPPSEPPMMEEIPAQLEEIADPFGPEPGGEPELELGELPLSMWEDESTGVPEFWRSINSTNPTGGDVTPPQVERLKYLGRVVFGEGSEAARVVETLAVMPKLGRAQAGRLIGLGKIAAERLGVGS